MGTWHPEISLGQKRSRTPYLNFLLNHSLGFTPVSPVGISPVHDLASPAQVYEMRSKEAFCLSLHQEIGRNPKWLTIWGIFATCQPPKRKRLSEHAQATTTDSSPARNAGRSPHANLYAMSLDDPCLKARRKAIIDEHETSHFLQFNGHCLSASISSCLKSERSTIAYKGMQLTWSKLVRPVFPHALPHPQCRTYCSRWFF